MARRNVVVVMSDEHDPRNMGCSGHPFVKTPNFDALASRGTRFVNAYTPSPICVPARAAFATGMRVHQTRHWDNAMPYFGAQRGWGHVLQEHGIRVESIGKLHYRAEEDPAGFDREHIPMHVVGGYGMVWGSIRDPFKPRHDGPRMLGERIGPGESTYTEYDREVTARAVQWLKDAAEHPSERPFVLYIGLVAPHFPFVVPEKYFGMYPPESMPEPKLHPKTGYVRHPWVQEYADFMGGEHRFVDNDERLRAFSAYYGLVSWLDYNVGQILQAIENSPLAEETTVIYTSDHGDNLGARGIWGKSTLYEESVKVPMIVAGPDIPVSVNETCVDLIDLFPTILQGASVDAAGEMGCRPGQSLLELAASPPNNHRVILSEYHAAGSNSAGFMVRKGRWKYHYYVGFRPELFDLDTDPEELRDLGEDPAHDAVRQEMHRELLAICDPQEVDRMAKKDQAALIDRFGGVEEAHKYGSSTSTPVASTSA